LKTYLHPIIHKNTSRSCCEIKLEQNWWVGRMLQEFEERPPKPSK
jgi:hypothetical protein